MLEVGVGPPVAQAALGVKGAALRVEGVTDLMADGCADRTVVGGGRRLRIKERRLQDGGGKVEGILQRQVYSIDGLRGHRPLVAVDGTAEARYLVLIFVDVGAPAVAEQVAGLDLVLRIVAV